MNTKPLTVQHAWADRCGIDRDDERAIEPHLYGWPEEFAIFRDGWDAAWLDCKPFLKDGETPAECIARNRADADLLLADLAKERLRAEKAEAAFAALSSTTNTVSVPRDSVAHAVEVLNIVNSVPGKSEDDSEMHLEALESALSATEGSKP